MKSDKKKDGKQGAAIKYEGIEVFAQRINKDRRTVYRFYNKNPRLREETVLKNGKRLIPVSHQKYWNNKMLFEKNESLEEAKRVLEEENRMMRNLVDYLYQNRNALAGRLWNMDWSLFVSVDYKDERNKAYCFTKMSKLYERLEKGFGAKTTLRMFFVTEPFANRKNGQHNHLVIHVGDNSLVGEVLELVKSSFPKDRVDSSVYTKYKGGLFYMLKNGNQGVDWDILGNNLKEEGERYEN